MYRSAPPTLAHALDAALASLGFSAVETETQRLDGAAPLVWQRKTWNTNRAVVLTDWDGIALPSFVEALRLEAYACPGRSHRSVLGLQLVLAMDVGELPAERDLAPHLDASTTAEAVLRHAIMVQSVFVVRPDVSEWSVAKSPSWFARWVDGRLHGAIANGLASARRA